MLVLKIGQKIKVEVASLGEASRTYRNHIEANDFGCSESPAAYVYRDGEKVAHVSYNGRVWGMDGKEIAR